jgi:hypothetical protein
MRKILGASVLMLALCGPAFGGIILCPPAPAPPPPSAMQEEQTVKGEVQNDANDAADSLGETVLNLIGSVLALL